MNLLVLGKGKMGTLILQLAQGRGHVVRSHDEFDNVGGCMLTPERLRDIDVVIDFTVPDAVIANVEAVARAGKNIVVGTTGWYQHMARVRQVAERAQIGFLYGANFSIGVNLFFEIARTAAEALKQGFTGQIAETHHIHKKDAPSGTAVKLQQVVEEACGVKVPIASIREGEVFGIHELLLDSAADSIRLVHDAKSRLGFAEGAVRAAEWLKGKHGFFDFKDLFREV